MKKTIRATEGEILKAARIAAGRTQAEITTALGLTSSQYISNIERDKCTLSPDQFKAVAKILGWDGTKTIRKIIAMRVNDYKHELLSKLNHGGS